MVLDDDPLLGPMMQQPWLRDFSASYKAEMDEIETEVQTL